MIFQQTNDLTELPTDKTALIYISNGVMTQYLMWEQIYNFVCCTTKDQLEE